MSDHWYFAYGSNMNPQRMAARGMRTLQARAGQLAGWRLSFNKRAHNRPGAAYANIVAAEAVVPGVLYQLRGFEDILRMDPNEGWPERYDRRQLTVSGPGGDVTAWVYIANRHWQAPDLLPERWYLNHLLSGRPWLPEQHYRSLQQQPCLA